MKAQFFKRTLTAAAVAASLTAALPATAQQQSSILGEIEAQNSQGLTVTATNPETGYSRQVEVVDGQFRFPAMASGSYQLQVRRGDEIVATRTVRVSLGTNATPVIEVGDDVETIQVMGSRISNVDVTTTNSGLVVGEVDFDKLPVARNLTSVALLAPGTVKGDTGFGNTASFGGASVAENSCYINGLEVTDTRQGLGCGSVPFEFYKEFQVKTGGMSPKYGRSTGGVINAVTKSGTNMWEFAAVTHFEPSGLQEEGSFSRGSGGVGNVFRDERVSENDEYSVSLSASGPIIEDTLFIYALVNPRGTESTAAAATGGQFAPDTRINYEDSSGSDNLFWGAKIDWDINANHRLSYFGYSDERTTERETFQYNPNTQVIGDEIGTTIFERGGTAHSLSYTGYWTDDLTVTAMAGEIETQYGSEPSNTECSTVVDTRDVDDPAMSCGPGGSIGENFDTNTQYRLDLEYYFGDHTIRAGYDYQERESTNVTRPIGGHSWTYATLQPGGSVQGDTGELFSNDTGAPIDYVSDRIFEGGGQFGSELSAYYIEDEWRVSDDVIVNIGLRKDKFEGSGTTDEVLYSFSTDWAPRLGVSWDVFGTGDTKVYATWGEYYLPVANNTIYRAASGVSDTTTYYYFDGIDGATGVPQGISPVNGSESNSQTTSSVSIVPTKPVFQSQEADPFARQEFIIGFEQSINDDLAFSLRGTYRDVTSALDDYCGIYAYPYCVLINPGEDSSWYKDGYYWDGTQLDEDKLALFDGQPDEGSLTTHPNDTTIQMPEANNEYLAWQSELKYRTDNFRMNFIYTWSRSTGNFEGAVKSDIDQADAGITQDFDFPALMDGAQGYQANDRRHVFKLFGSYDIDDNWTVGVNSTLSSGRPLSAFGRGYPSNDPNIYGSYGDTFYLADCDDAGDCTYDRVPRGTVGRTPWTFNVDASIAYNFTVADVDMKASLDVFNVLNNQEATSTNEHYEVTEGNRNQWYGAAYSWQSPRYVRLGFEARF